MPPRISLTSPTPMSPGSSVAEFDPVESISTISSRRRLHLDMVFRALRLLDKATLRPPGKEVTRTW